MESIQTVRNRPIISPNEVPCASGNPYRNAISYCIYSNKTQGQTSLIPDRIIRPPKTTPPLEKPPAAEILLIPPPPKQSDRRHHPSTSKPRSPSSRPGWRSRNGSSTTKPTSTALTVPEIHQTLTPTALIKARHGKRPRSNWTTDAPWFSNTPERGERASRLLLSS